MRLGFIGIGNMGKPMAVNLLKANHQLAIYDLNPKPLEELAKMGAVVKVKPSEIPPEAEVIFLSLPSHVVVEEVMLGVNGVVSTLREGQIVIDTTTSLPSVSRRIAEKVKALGADFLDASLSGGPDGATAQTLTFMVGGEASVLEKVRSLLETLGKKTPRILNGNFKPMFALDLEYKDLSLGTMVAQELKAPALLASLAKGLFEMARAKGLGSEDNVALVKVFEEMSNVQVRK
jgi:3-hydroxyisobutyrate dehydrogenase-like beta-hydroxyacid dehydrogenase